jgi:cyclopropane fatty-acyl-phospholipid synthase-like methyltransferase
MMQRLFFELKYLLSSPPWDSGESPPELIQYLAVHGPGRALDLGCGTGTNSIEMASMGWEVIGVDLSHLAIRRARRKARQAGVKIDFKRGDVTQLDWIETPFDLILDIGCLHALSPQGRMRYARNVKRLTSPGARYLLYSFLSEELTVQSLQAYFSPEFDPISTEFGVDQAASGRQSVWLKFQRIDR